MPFQACLDNLQTRTGQSPDDVLRQAAAKAFTAGGTLKAGVKAGEVIAWLKTNDALGHGHAMAIVALLKGKEGGA